MTVYNYGYGYPLIGLLILALDIWALVSLWAGRSTLERKLIWTLLIILLPVVGMALFLLIGKNSTDASLGEDVTITRQRKGES